MLLMFWFSLKVEVIKKLFECSACLKSKKKKQACKNMNQTISTLDQHQPEDHRPEGCYWSLGLIWGVIQIL